LPIGFESPNSNTNAAASKKITTPARLKVIDEREHAHIRHRLGTGRLRDTLCARSDVLFTRGIVD